MIITSDILYDDLYTKMLDFFIEAIHKAMLNHIYEHSDGETREERAEELLDVIETVIYILKMEDLYTDIMTGLVSSLKSGFNERIRED